MTVEEFESAVGQPLTDFALNCHAASVKLVRSGAVGTSRVARGTCPGVGGQHSWVVLGNNCFDRSATVIDPTLWSYDSDVKGVWVGSASDRPHIPFGSGSIWNWSRPIWKGGPIIRLDAELSEPAAFFLRMVGPLDREGWGLLAHCPVGDWPAAEILGAMYDDERVSQLVPIDIIGMATDRMPGYGSYNEPDEGEATDD